MRSERGFKGRWIGRKERTAWVSGGKAPWMKVASSMGFGGVEKWRVR
jgi:hypothetical protein